MDAPDPVPVAVTKPTTLSSGASVMWDELAPHAIALGTLEFPDVRAFSVLCELEATSALASSRKGQTPGAVQLERQTAAALRPYLEMFGLAGPESRRRLPSPAPAEVNPLNRFIARKRPKWAGVLP